MSDEATTEATEVMDTTSETPEGVIPDATTEGSDLKSEPDEDAETFPREYVEKLRTENGKYRQRAGEADALATRLHTELVRATGRLADPTDLPFDADHIADAGKMVAAIDALLEAKPHLASRRPTGDIGQGNRGQGGGSFSLLQMLKDRT
ncbi:hypothetical protein PUR22_10625 [Mycolicibacterium porcinum]|uniref:hypothetical protein n=1 Tax=Mycolicibacterium porcinum TaxID=39693 RepID=UPI0031F82441